MSAFLVLLTLAVIFIFLSSNARMGALEQKNRILAQENLALRMALGNTPESAPTPRRWGCLWILLVLLVFFLLLSTLMQPLG